MELPPVAPGTYVRDSGSDIRKGTLALPAGTRMGPAQLGGLLAALGGLTTVEVREPWCVLLVTTGGDEVVEPGGEELTTGKIFDSNGTLLEASLRQAGLDVVRTGISDDDPPSRLLAVLRRHTAQADSRVDVIVTTGGSEQGSL